MESAISFILPGMCLACICMLYERSIRVRCLIKDITLLFLEVFLLIISTKALLSDLIMIFLPAREFAQV